MVATTVFFVKPPIKSMVTSVVMIQMNTADQNGENPRYTMGRYHSRMEKKVNRRPTPPFTPCFPPTRTRTTR